ncbi:hypothetical protein C8R47DRAFT_1066441 [Mycena vitilis]|nr:hypothetical protein C8R47DRAFT_1066441 [Mycena vitilis]
MPVIALDQLLGMLLLGTWLSSVLFGVVLVEATKYFTSFPNDSWKRKGLVILVLTLLVAAMVGEYGNAYLPTVTYWGDFAGLTTLFWTFPLASFTSAVISTIVDCYLIYRFYTLSKNIWITLFLYALMLLAVGGYLVIFVLLPTASRTHVRIHFTFSATRRFTVGTQQAHTLTIGIIVNFSAQAAVDVLIAAGLIWKLRSMKSNFKSTNTFLNRVMVGAVRTGSPTAICSILALITYLHAPKGDVSTFFFLQFAPLYTLTLLSNFNVRRHGQNVGQAQMTETGPGVPRVAAGSSEIHIHRTAIVFTDPTDSVVATTTSSDDLEKNQHPRHTTSTDRSSDVDSIGVQNAVMTEKN